MDKQDFLMDAVDQILAWDMPEESFDDAVNSQASFMAKVDLDEDAGYWLH